MVVTAAAPQKNMTSITARCANVWILSTKTRVWSAMLHTLGTRTVTLAITTRIASMMAAIAALKKQQKAMQAGAATISVQRKICLLAVPAPARPRMLRLHAQNHATPYNGKAMAIVMIKIMYVAVVGMEEIAADRKGIFSTAPIVYVGIRNMVSNQLYLLTLLVISTGCMDHIVGVFCALYI